MVKSANNKASRRRSRAVQSTLAKRRLTLEGLEARQLLAAAVAPVTGNVNPAAIVSDNVQPANIGSVEAFNVNELELVGQTGLNDQLFNAQLIPLGTAANQEPIVDVSGTLSLVQTNNPTQQPEDVDFFAADLRAGDILDVGALGGVGGIDVFYETGRRWFAVESNTSNPLLLPDNSPLQTLGAVVGAQVVPETGRYYFRVATNGQSASYTLGLRTYRPFLESQPIGTEQIVFIDFDGYVGALSDLQPLDFTDPANPVPSTGTIRVDGLVDFMPNFGLLTRDEDELINKILQRVEEDFNVGVANLGGNGSYDLTGIPGQFGIRILNSRDHADPFGVPNVTRVIVGGTNTDISQTPAVLGISETIDVGNFDTSELVFSPLDQVLPYTAGIPISGAQSTLDLVAQTIAVTVSHELGHSFGLYHTDGTNNVGSLIDGPGPPVQAFDFELGPDGIFGTEDDEQLIFPDSDRFSLVEGYLGFERTAASLAFALSTGTAGGSVAGRVYSDFNGNGSGVGDAGLAGVTVFADVNGNGLFDASEPRAVSGDDGTYVLSGAPGAVAIGIILPANSTASTATSQQVTIPTSGTVSGVDFGVVRTRSDITGTKFADLNGNGTREANEPGIGGVYVYLDLDGDDRPDLGEPRAITAADGTYNINFPGPGTYTIREVVEAGFIQTFPVSGEHTVVFNGTVLNGNFNFGNQPARDFGDAPDGYAVTVAEGGANHGIVIGLSLGTNVDRELDGTHSAGADFDDLNGELQLDGTIRDDEDGVRSLVPLAPGATGSLNISATNTTGKSAYLQGWLDFNRNTIFEASEQIFVNELVGTTTSTDLPVFIPDGTEIGSIVGRFRYSHTLSLPATGSADSGEVEDHIFNIQATPNILNDDLSLTVPRNSVAVPLDVLANDFQLPGTTLTISRLDTTLLAEGGSARISSDGRTVLYTPPNGYVGLDQFRYFVNVPGVGERSAAVKVNVTFQTAQPIAVDDTYEVPQGVTNRPLNVLDNDIASVNGGLSIASFGQGDQGGTVGIVGGGQSLRYTPANGFAGTEQFSYAVTDSLGQTSMAQVTINVLPGSRDDDQVEFSFELRDTEDNRIIDNVTVGQEFYLSVLVDDIRNIPFLPEEGVGSAFLDLLYTDELVATVPVTGAANGYPFDITFGPLFSGDSTTFRQGDAATPGLLNEIGGTQPFGSGNNGQGQAHTGPAVLFTVKMQAVQSGVATFQADPADDPQSEVLVLGGNAAVPVSGLRLGNAELLIVDNPATGQATKALDDPYLDGLDPNDGSLIVGGSDVNLPVLANDLINGTIVEFGLQTAPTRGTATVNDAGTPNDFSDDYIVYRANAGVNAVDRFTYVIVTADGFRSTAEVSVAVGAAGADDDVFFDFRFVTDDLNNPTPLTALNVGDRFGVQVYVDDLRGPTEATVFGVFAGYLDILYDRGLVSPTNQLNTDFGFDVVFDPQFNDQAAVGTITAPGFINEFGSFQRDTDGEAGPLGGEPELMATLFFRANAAGNLKFKGDKADFSPFQDTLLYDPPGRVDPSMIRYDVESINITVPSGESPLQNGLNPMDVDADGYVSPIDVLGVVNTLNRMGREGVQGEAASFTSLFVDVDGDSQVTPFDALQVINYLNQQSRSRSINGESAPLVSSPTASPAALRTDEVFAGVGQADSDRVVSADSDASSTSRPAAVAPIESTNNDQDDDDDILTLLADDVATVWT